MKHSMYLKVPLTAKFPLQGGSWPWSNILALATGYLLPAHHDQPLYNNQPSGSLSSHILALYKKHFQLPYLTPENLLSQFVKIDVLFVKKINFVSSIVQLLYAACKAFYFLS